jgi:DNA-binding CsgD family transcriptional regulator
MADALVWCQARIARRHQEGGRGTTAPLLLSAQGLSPREAEVARLVLRGAPTRVISSTVHISENTVQDHLKWLFDKVGLRGRRERVGQFLRR